MGRPKYTPEERITQFWNLVDKSGGDDACWIWTAGLDFDGYGQFWWNSHNWKTHRVAYLLAVGTFPPELKVLHSCDNPPCCNPAHLFLGTNQDNVDDREHKGRGNAARGEGHGNHKLTDDQVKEIRRRYTTGLETQKQLSVIFGVCRQHVSRIVNYIDRRS